MQILSTLPCFDDVLSFFFFVLFLAYPCRLLLTVKLSASQDHYGFMLFLTEWCVFRVALSPKYTLVYTKKNLFNR